MRKTTIPLLLAIATLTMASPAQAMELAVQDEQVFVDQRYSTPEIGCELAQGLGASYVRFNAWPGREWKITRAIEEARACGLKVQVTLTGRPAYAGGPDQPNPRVFARWAAERAREWKSVKRFSVWNEPNHSAFLKNANPRSYARIFRASYKSIKRARPDAQVLMGETAPMHTAARWIKRLAGAKPGPSDGFAHHPYEHPGEPRIGAYSISHMLDLRRDLYKLGLRSPRGKRLPVYATEFGYPHHENQAELLQSAIAKARKAGVKQVLLYQLVQPDHGGWDTSLVDHKGCPYASYTLLARRARDCIGAMPAFQRASASAFDAEVGR